MIVLTSVVQFHSRYDLSFDQVDLHIVSTYEILRDLLFSIISSLRTSLKVVRTALLISCLFRLQWSLPIRRYSVIRSLSNSQTRPFKMSSRKSARLIAAASMNKDNANHSVESPPKVANISRKRKNAPQDEAEPPSKKTTVPPLTPKKKWIVNSIPPVTPTPAAVGLMTLPYSSGDIDDTAPPLNRLVVPNGTNAPLVTPETHRVLANKSMDQLSPSKPPNTKQSTGKVLNEALAHLIKVEPRLKPVIDAHHCHVFSPEGLAEEIDPFRSLASGIISQQVSCKHPENLKKPACLHHKRSLEQLQKASRRNSWLFSIETTQIPQLTPSPHHPRFTQVTLSSFAPPAFRCERPSTSMVSLKSSILES